MRVLVTDDDRAMADCLRAVLESAGHEAEVAFSGSEALAQGQRRAPDCILLDIRMPGISGLETLCRLRSLGITCPVIFMTGYSVTRLIEGRNGVLAKLSPGCDAKMLAQWVFNHAAPGPLLIGHTDPTLCQLLWQTLRQRELSTLTTTNLEQALVAFESESCQAIILSLPSNCLPGFVVHELHPGLIVHLLTLMDWRLSANQLGYLQKPFPMEKLIHAIDRMTSERSEVRDTSAARGSQHLET